MLGSKLSSLVIKHIENKYKGYVVNIIVASKNGTPDLIACISGLFFAFEIKGHSDVKRPLQDQVLLRISKAKGYGGYVFSIKDVDRIVKNRTKFELSGSTCQMKL